MSTMKTIAFTPGSTLRKAIRTSSPSVRVHAGLVADVGAHSQTGTSRTRNEDVVDYVTNDDTFLAFAAVHDGHGGIACAQFLKEKLLSYLKKHWNPAMVAQSLEDAFIDADSKLLAPSGFMGMGERGVGGSKCGATSAIALIIKDPATGAPALVTANVGDARTVLVREHNGDITFEELFEEHVPDIEKERIRIESKNPNPKKPLVTYVGGTWRLGGLLALSRCFGDAAFKSTMQFEGIGYQGSDYSSGFGLIAKPWVKVTPLDASCKYVVVASDGLFNEEVRGGGGGITPQDLSKLVIGRGSADAASSVARQLSERSAEEGSIDDISCIVLKLDTSALPPVPVSPTPAESA